MMISHEKKGLKNWRMGKERMLVFKITSKPDLCTCIYRIKQYEMSRKKKKTRPVVTRPFPILRVSSVSLLRVGVLRKVLTKDIANHNPSNRRFGSKPEWAAGVCLIVPWVPGYNRPLVFNEFSSATTKQRKSPARLRCVGLRVGSSSLSRCSWWSSLLS